MEITERSLYECLGLTPPDEGGKGQEVADPEVNEGGKAQDVADPAAADVGGDPETEAGLADHEEADDPAAGTPMTPQQRRENAARRREQERQAAINEAVEAERARHNQEMERMILDMNLQDPETGDPITTMEQFKAFRQKQREAAFSRKAADGTLTREDIVRIIQEQQGQTAQQQAQQEAQQQAQQEAQQRLQQELQEIQKLDASITSFGSLLTMPGAEQFREKVNKGYSLIDAFTLVRGPVLQQAQLEAARAAAVRNSTGKEHLGGTGNGRGAGTVQVPADEMRMYRILNPGVSDADILNHYNKNRK